MQKLAASARCVSRTVPVPGGRLQALHRAKGLNMRNVMQIVERQTDGPALAIYSPDPFEVYANAVAPRTIIGTLLRFTKGDYVAGEEGKEIPEGSTLLQTWMNCWLGG